MTRTDEHGPFLFPPNEREMSSREFESVAAKANGSASVQTKIGEETHVEISRWSGPDLDGRIIDEDGRPIPNATVRFQNCAAGSETPGASPNEIEVFLVHASNGDGRRSSNDWSTASGVDGSFSLHGIPCTPAIVTARQRGFLPETREHS